ncbi:hypothetical protein ACFC14_08100 [Microbacterium sp. NPDC055988]|uniref:hypothetical protein n=1 Tax=Microbacterium sp. NPDC055988 TaxID=3345671 RepID=UPI0035D84F78
MWRVLSNHPFGTRAIVAAFLVSLLALAGCQSGEPYEADRLVGRTLSDLPEERDYAWLIYDLSFPILGIEPTYEDSDKKDDWAIVAACNGGEESSTLGESLALGVIPRDEFESVREAASNREFNSLLIECSGQSR